MNWHSHGIWTLGCASNKDLSNVVPVRGLPIIKKNGMRDIFSIERGKTGKYNPFECRVYINVYFRTSIIL
jgi:hypothetical protein